jgi:hypothetical protein
MSSAIRFTDAQIEMLLAAVQRIDDEQRRRTFLNRIEARLQFRAGPLRDDLQQEAIRGAMKGLYCKPAAA